MCEIDVLGWVQRGLETWNVLLASDTGRHASKRWGEGRAHVSMSGARSRLRPLFSLGRAPGYGSRRFETVLAMRGARPPARVDICLHAPSCRTPCQYI
jgi:hypothetical protein